MTTLILRTLGPLHADHWQRWWMREDPRSQRVEPDPDLETWLAAAAAALEDEPGAILVAHGIACALVAHLAASRPDLWIGGALLVAPADVEDETRTPYWLPDFAPLPLERFSFPSIVVGSSDDPHVSISRAMLFAYAWGARFIHLRNSGHIDEKSGFGAWPDGRRLARRLEANGRRSDTYLRVTQAGAPGFV